MSKFGIMFSIVFSAVIAGCGGEDDSFTCSLGSLEGVWYFDYTQLSGNCGPIQDGIVSLPTPIQLNGYKNLSADKCNMSYTTWNEYDDGATFYRETGTATQFSEHFVYGTFTVEIESLYRGNCVGTYDVELTKQ